MTKSKKAVMAVVALGLGLGAAAAARAGAKFENKVSVGPSTHPPSASGDFGTARASSDTVQFIGCEIYAYDGTRGHVRCYARDAAGNRASCVSAVTAGDLRYLTVAAIGTAGELSFFADEEGGCTEIVLTKSSSYRPMTP